MTEVRDQSTWTAQYRFSAHCSSLFLWPPHSAPFPLSGLPLRAPLTLLAPLRSSRPAPFCFSLRINENTVIEFELNEVTFVSATWSDVNFANMLVTILQKRYASWLERHLRRSPFPLSDPPLCAPLTLHWILRSPLTALLRSSRL